MSANFWYKLQLCAFYIGDTFLELGDYFYDRRCEAVDAKFKEQRKYFDKLESKG